MKLKWLVSQARKLNACDYNNKAFAAMDYNNFMR